MLDRLWTVDESQFDMRTDLCQLAKEVISQLIKCSIAKVVRPDKLYPLVRPLHDQFNGVD